MYCHCTIKAVVLSVDITTKFSDEGSKLVPGDHPDKHSVKNFHHFPCNAGGSQPAL